MGRLAELRRRPGAAAALHVLTVQRCAAAFVVMLSYGALLWVMYSVWLRDVSPEDELRPGPATLPVDYETYRTSERARAAYRTAESEREVNAGSEGYSARVVTGVRLEEDSEENVRYRTEETNILNEDSMSEGDNDDSTDAQSDADFEDNLVDDFDDEGEEDAFEDEDEDEEEEEEDTEAPPNRRLLVFNSVPHTGSEVMTVLLRWLAAQNGFQYAQLRTQRTTPGPLEQTEQVRCVSRYDTAHSLS